MQDQIDKDFQKFEVVIFTDGSCHPNPGPGGWACVLLYKTQVKGGSRIVERELSGGEESTTNNRMEIRAVVEALEILKRPCDVKVYSDSRYVVQSIGHWWHGKPAMLGPGWVHKWKLRGWMSSTNEPVKNVDLLERLMAVAVKHKAVEMCHVKGHVGHEYNERCDQLAVAEKLKVRELLRKEKCDGKDGEVGAQEGRPVRDSEEGGAGTQGSAGG